MSFRPTALLIGDWERVAFRTARQVLDRVLPAVVARDVRQALRELRRDASFTYLIVAQSFPGEFTLGTLQQLQRRRDHLRQVWQRIIAGISAREIIVFVGQVRGAELPRDARSTHDRECLHSSAIFNHRVPGS